MVLPEHDAVVAVTSGDTDMQGVLDGIWEHLLPALTVSQASPEPGVHEALVERLAGLRLDPPGAGELWAREVPEGAVAWSGRRIAFEPNPLEVRWAVLELGERSDRLSVAWGRRTYTLDLGHATWALGTLRVPGARRREERTAASGAWVGPRTYEVTLRRIETPHCHTWRLTVDDDDAAVRVEGEVDVAFGPGSIPHLGEGIGTNGLAPRGRFGTHEHFAGERFIEVADELPTLREVAHRNAVRITVRKAHGLRTPTLIVLSAIDNLMKGAAGQAVQNMNLMFGLSEGLGLDGIALLP